MTEITFVAFSSSHLILIRPFGTLTWLFFPPPHDSCCEEERWAWEGTEFAYICVTNRTVWSQILEKHVFCLCLYITKTLVSVTFNWAKQDITGQQFLNQNSSNGLPYQMLSKSKADDSLCLTCGRIMVLLHCQHLHLESQ